MSADKLRKQDGRFSEPDMPPRTIVARHRNLIRKALKKIGRWYWFHFVLDRPR